MLFDQRLRLVRTLGADAFERVRRISTEQQIGCRRHLRFEEERGPKIIVQRGTVRTGARSVLSRERTPCRQNRKKQQMAAGAALAAKRGERPVSSLKGASRQMAQSMNEKQLEEFAHTKRKGLPRK